MPTDSYAWRLKFGVMGPSTNSIVQPEFDDMRPIGVSNHYSRIRNENAQAISNELFMSGARRIGKLTYDAIDWVVNAKVDYMVMGMSAVTFDGGGAGAEQFIADVKNASGLDVSVGSHSTRDALRAYGGIKKIALISPYWPAMNETVSGYFAEYGFEVVRDVSLKCRSWTAIAEVSEATLIEHLKALDGDDIDAIVQVGTNLCMARLAGEAERWLGKPVIAINTATYWHALRANGIKDRVPGFGTIIARLLKARFRDILTRCVEIWPHFFRRAVKKFSPRSDWAILT